MKSKVRPITPSRIGFMSEITNNNFAEQVKYSYRAKPYSFKKKTPTAGAYPQNYSPYRLASPHALNTAVKLSPAEVFSDCKLLQHGILQEFQSKYFDEAEGGHHSKDSNKTISKPPIRNCGQRRISSSRNCNQREPSYQGLPVPQSIAEERRQLRAAMHASISPLECSPLTSKTLEPIDIKQKEDHTVSEERIQRPVRAQPRHAKRTADTRLAATR